MFSINFVLLKSLKGEHETYEGEIEEKNEFLEVQRKEINQINEELKISIENTQIQKQEIEKKNQDITASINYALRIQQAVLPFERRFEESFGKENYFIFFRPKDIVSGDFYWLAHKAQDIFLAVGDCTGHGVPGAFMSMISINFLEQIVHDRHINQPNEILNTLDKSIRHGLRQEQSAGRDGLDICLVRIEQQNRKISYAGAMNPLYIVENQSLQILKATKKPIGGIWEGDKNFEQKQVELSPKSIIYLCSDGYQDQFGGKENRKFMVGNFRKLLLEISSEELYLQKQILAQRLQAWMDLGKEHQIDDVSVLGICL